MNLSKLRCCVVDQGLFVGLARALGKQYEHVYYTTPGTQGAFPSMLEGRIGEGIPEIEVILDYHDVVDKCDFLCFPDVNYGSEQEYLASNGIPIWGSRKAESLELEREQTKELMIELDLPVGPYEVVKGVKALREYLKEHPKVWVKLSRWRAQFESFFSECYALAHGRVDKIDRDLGPLAEATNFIVEKNLPDKIEAAIDGYCVDAVFPSKVMWGVEDKALAYVGRIERYDKLPKCMTDFDRAMAPFLAKSHYCNFYDPETRIGKDGIGFMNDMCARAGSPPSEGFPLMYENLPEIVAEGAINRKCVDPVCAGKWMVELILHSSWAQNEPLTVRFPKQYDDNVRLRNCVREDGDWHVLPQTPGISQIGGVCAVGDTYEEALDEVKEIAESIHPSSDIDIRYDAPDRAYEKMQKLKSYGLE
jgi:predicted RNase H-like HicB family nuclease